MIGGFRSSLLWLDAVSSCIHCGTDELLVLHMYSGCMREQCLVRIMRIKILQSLTTTARIEMHQSPIAVVLLTMRHSQSTDHRLMKTSSKLSKRRDPHPCDNIISQTINKLSSQTIMNNILHNIGKGPFRQIPLSRKVSAYNH